MVFENSIPFGAPSQLRLRMTCTTAGVANFAVLDAFNEPIGNLKNMSVPLADVQSLMSGSKTEIEAKSSAAVLKIKVGHDNLHEMYDVHYDDPDKWRTGDGIVLITDLQELVAASSAAPA